MADQAEGNSQKVKIKIGEKKIRESKQQKYQKERTENTGKKIIIEIIQEDFLELKDVLIRKDPPSAQHNINRIS